jgi:RHS repeat-associated protein
LQNLHYTYDPAGNITHIRDDAHQTIYFRNQRVEPSNDYVYDALYRLIQADGREHLGQAAGGQRLPPTAADGLGGFHTRLDHPGDGNAVGTYTERYVYDAVGNFVQMQHRGSDPAHPGWTRAYTYAEASLIEDGNDGEPLKISNRLTSTTLSPAGTTPQPEGYLHDAHGNMLRMPHLGGGGAAGPNMGWDYRDQWDRVDKGGGGTAYYSYDASGQRVRKVWEKAPNLVEERIYLGAFEIFRRHAGAIGANTSTLERETLHVMDDKQRIALVETRTLDAAGDDQAPRQLTRYQLGNHLGSASLELDDQAQIISYEEYAPYGSSTYQAVRSQTEAAKRYRYTGKERDEESALYYHGARYYAAWLGRWTACDRSGIDDGLNIYAYVADRPMSHVDPDGRANTPIHEDLTRLVALQYVEPHIALRIGRATNVPDTEPQFESIDASIAGDPESINRDVHVLGSGTRQQKVDAAMARFARKDLRFSADPIRDAGIYLLHPIQDASYHGASFGRGMGHALTPESDLAVGDKSFAEFYQVVKDTEKGIELMQEKGIIDRSKPPDRLTKTQWAGIYRGLKSIEDQYSVALGLLNFLGVGGRLVGPLTGLVGGVLGAAIGAVGGFFAALFSGKNVAKGAARAAESGFVVGQAILGVGLGTIAGLGTNVMKNQLRNEAAEKQSAYLRERIYDIKEEMMKKAVPPKMDRLEGAVSP